MFDTARATFNSANEAENESKIQQYRYALDRSVPLDVEIQEELEIREIRKLSLNVDDIGDLLMVLRRLSKPIVALLLDSCDACFMDHILDEGVLQADQSELFHSAFTSSYNSRIYADHSKEKCDLQEQIVCLQQEITLLRARAEAAEAALSQVPRQPLAGESIRQVEAHEAP